jgi:hypothetical protein
MQGLAYNQQKQGFIALLLFCMVILAQSYRSETTQFRQGWLLLPLRPQGGRTRAAVYRDSVTETCV